MNQPPPDGWSLVATGRTNDPAAHGRLLELLREVLSDVRFGTGSSEFNGRHAAEANFHTRPRPANQAAGAAAAGDAYGQGGAHYPSSGNAPVA